MIVTDNNVIGEHTYFCFKPDVILQIVADLADLLNKYIVVSAEYNNCLRVKLGLNTLVENPTYTNIHAFHYLRRNLRNHEASLTSFGISTIEEELCLPKEH